MPYRFAFRVSGVAWNNVGCCDVLSRVDMPTYECLCKKCKKIFEISCTITALCILLFFTTAPAAAPAQAHSLISLDLRNADLVDVLRMLAQIGSLNVIISSEVKGTVTRPAQGCVGKGCLRDSARQHRTRQSSERLCYRNPAAWIAVKAAATERSSPRAHAG